MYSKTKCSRDHNLAVLSEARIVLVLQYAVPQVIQLEGEKTAWDNIHFKL